MNKMQLISKKMEEE